VTTRVVSVTVTSKCLAILYLLITLPTFIPILSVPVKRRQVQPISATMTAL